MEKLAFVTGTSSGLGRAIAENLIRTGWKVHGFSRRDPGLGAPAYEHHTLDLSRPSETARYFRGAFGGPLDRARGPVALVNNAGQVGPVAPTAELDPESLERAYALNTVTPVWLMGYFLAKVRSDLRIANISTGAAVKAYPGWSAYCGSKAALRMAGQVAAEELERVYRRQKPGFRLAILSYQPGVVDTAMQAEIRAVDPGRFPDKPRFLDLHESGALVPPEDSAAPLCRWLDAPDGAGLQEIRFG